MKRSDFKGCVWRELCARAIEANYGYSRGYGERFALEWTVGIYVGVPDSDDLLDPRKGKPGVWEALRENWSVTREEFEATVSDKRLAEWREEWDDERNKSNLWQFVVEVMADDFRGSVQGTTWASVRPEIANRYGLGYYSPVRFERRDPDKDRAYYPAKVEGWKRVSEFANVPDFDATFEFHGRGGKHLCLVEFEGVSIEHSSDDLADLIRNHNDERGGCYSNEWCQKLLAYIHECDLMFTSKLAGEEFEYQCRFRAADELHDLYEQCKAEREEAAEVEAVADSMAAEGQWERICNEQGWNEASQIVHLEGFIRQRGLFPDFAAYAAEAQREENRS